uniref:Uncharacterized protein TCIL3000_10_3070 n=1 Tax=Trypanosoma congolense (strain IL3000) TaxID=1068625 RepID=G0UVY0_TRYCI|nr:unnamed protein product [Trypanosoma congolense IL3000]
MLRTWRKRTEAALRPLCSTTFVFCRQRSAMQEDSSMEDKGIKHSSDRDYERPASLSPSLHAVEGKTRTHYTAAYPGVRVALQDRDHCPTENETEPQGRHGSVEAQGRSHEGSSSQLRETSRLEESEVCAFLLEKQSELAEYYQQRNSTIPCPPHPDDLVPEFRRVKRHQQMLVIASDPDYPVHDRRDNFPQLPPTSSHPWVKNTPMGPFIIHGDGQLGVVGTGEVGFEDPFTSTTEPLTDEVGAVAQEALPLPRAFRGLQHRSVLQQRLPSMNGKVLPDAVIKNSFTLTGRGVFATRDIAAGETIMIVCNTSRNLGVKGEIERLVEMCGDILLETFNSVVDGSTRKLDFLHDWILTGQPSSLLLHWPERATEQVVGRIGGDAVLYELELHRAHVARLAAIIDMNSFLVESTFAVRKGMAYFPEAGFFNHSCVPNATYDIIPAHTFRETDYYVDEADVGTCSAFRFAADRGVKSTDGGENAVSETSRCVNDAGYDDRTEECLVNASEDTAIEICPRGAVEYLFCCRATSNIASGSEILISYVPPEWSFDNRQYVLHDRYRFWCKCPKCAPTLDSHYARTPRLLVAMLIFSIFLQLLVMRQREIEHAAVRERMIEDDEEDNESQRRASSAKRSRSYGLFEIVEGNRQEEIYSFDRGPMPVALANDPWARPAR